MQYKQSNTRRSARRILAAAAAITTLAFGSPTAAADSGGDAGALTPAEFKPTPAHRLIDTRTGHGIDTAGHDWVRTTIRGNGHHVHSDATAVVATITAVNPGGTGYVTAYQATEQQPLVSSLNFSAATGTVANTAVIPFAGTSDDLIVAVGGTTDVDVIVDVVGFYTPATASTDGRHVSVPVERFDTQAGWAGRQAGKVPADGHITVDAMHVPDRAYAAVATITTHANEGDGQYITAYPAGAERPWVSHQNAPNDTVRSVTAIVPVSSDGKLSVYSYRSAHLIVEISGYITGQDAEMSTSGLFVAATAPERLADTREGHGGPWRAGEIRSFDVPPGASGVYNLTVVRPDRDGEAAVWPAGGPVAGVPNVRFGAGTTTAGLVIADHSTDDKIAVHANAYTHIVVDVAGWHLR